MGARGLGRFLAIVVAACGGGGGGGPDAAPDAFQAGVPSGGCGDGFVHDETGGCAAALPPERCPDGVWAAPGVTECRPLVDCGAPPYGGVATDGATEHVDGSYMGGGSDGSFARPWLTVQAGVDAAAPGAIVAVAAGTYAASTVIQGKPVHLWGRCPALVELQAIDVGSGGDGTIIEGIAAAGAGGPAIRVTSAAGVTLLRVRLHDAPGGGLALASAGATLADSLIERAGGAGVAAVDVQESTLAIEGLRLRGGRDAGGVALGAGLAARGALGAPLTVTGSHFDQVGGWAVSTGVPTTIDSSLISDCDDGVSIFASAAVTIRRSVIEGGGYGVQVMNGAGTVENTTVRGMPPVGDSASVGIRAAAIPPATSSLVVRDTLVEGFERVFYPSVDTDRADVDIEGLLLRGNEWGLFLNQDSFHLGDVTPQASVRRSLVEENGVVGINVVDIDTTIEGSLVRNTQALGGPFGDGVAVLRATATVAATRLEHNGRAGLGNFGGAVTVRDSRFECNVFDLVGSTQLMFTFDDQGNNLCACDGASEACRVQTADIAPPSLIGP